MTSCYAEVNSLKLLNLDLFEKEKEIPILKKENIELHEKNSEQHQQLQWQRINIERTERKIFDLSQPRTFFQICGDIFSIIARTISLIALSASKFSLEMLHFYHSRVLKTNSEFLLQVCRATLIFFVTLCCCNDTSDLLKTCYFCA